MPFLGLLLVVAAGAAVWWWRLKMLKEVGSEVIDSVERMRGAYQRRQYRKAAEAAPLTSIRDPAIAGVTFFLCLADEKSAQMDAAKALIRKRMQDIIDAKDIEEVIVFAEWTGKRVISAEDPVRRFRDLWLQHLDTGERRELIGIAEDICHLGGAPTPDQTMALQTLKRALLN
jgi:hypothetical protein